MFVSRENMISSYAREQGVYMRQEIKGFLCGALTGEYVT